MGGRLKAANEASLDKEQFLDDWRKQGPLGTLLDVINYIKTPQQYEVFKNFQDLANRELPAEDQRILEPVKPVVTRWNSYYSAFKRAAVVKDYIKILQPLKAATKRLEGRGNSSRFGAIYKVIPVFKYLLHKFEQRYKPYELVNFEATRAPEDYLAINAKAA
ncbi:hypothetical protein P3342_007558 [Pyrenophora teres f. teres]|nr:hypothetical protein P3342_007558 [Pyrenophora teres f. teres]